MGCVPCGKAKDLRNNIISWARSGFTAPDSATLLNRIKTCDLCEHFNRPLCNKCGCVIMLKARMATAKCPIGKW